MSRKERIIRYAHLVMAAYAGHEGLKTFYRINDVKEQNFNDHAPAYYQMLLGAVPQGYRIEVDAKVQELRKSLKEDVVVLVKSPKKIQPLAVEEEPVKGEKENELTRFGNGDESVGRQLWDAQEIGPPRENE